MDDIVKTKLFIGALFAICLLVGAVGCSFNPPVADADSTTAKKQCVNRHTTNRDNPMQYIDCETCGAHVLEWWYLRNDADTEFVAVCSKCYDANN